MQYKIYSAEYKMSMINEYLSRDITIRDFAKTAVRVFPERNISLEFANAWDEKEPVLDFSKKTPEILDSSRLEALGWKAEIDIAEGIKRAVGTMEEREE